MTQRGLFSPWTPLQFSTLVRTLYVVRARYVQSMRDSDFRPPGVPKPPEPIELKFSMIDDVQHTTQHVKIETRHFRGRGGVGVKLPHRVLF